MDKVYESQTVESEILEFWTKNNYFNDHNHHKTKRFSLVLPPPNVTGRLHCGHALNNTLQDIIVRIKRMEGYDIMWVPGIDHAGIATQSVVEKKLAKEAKNKKNMSSEEFMKEIWDWTNQHKNIIINQIKQLGASCNWDCLKFTLDNNFVTLVRETFVELYQRGLIYRGKYVTNWCSKCQTVISDEEVNVSKQAGHMYYVKYNVFVENSLVKPDYIVIATTRPETLFGDTAIGVNSSDERYKSYHNKNVLVPIVNRVIPIITDHTIDKEFGSGALKITPAHDKIDFQLGQKHKLDIISIIDRYNKLLPEFQTENINGNINTIRNRILEILSGNNLLVKIEPYECTIKKCYRCDSLIENVVSDQWYVKMQPLADRIQEQNKDNNMNFYPEYQKNIYNNWLNNISDWCISRQIVWGHKIPAGYCECSHITVSNDPITHCESCKNPNITHDNDVLDTWFSSWLWSFGVFNKDDDLKKYFPLDVIVTGSDILFFWITKMIMSSQEFRNTNPFKDIILHGLIRDKTGTKMSKSLGNVIDPLEVMKTYGTDALRFSLIFAGSTDKDIKMDIESVKIGKGLATKLWNAARFIINKFEYNKTLQALKPSDQQIESNKEINHQTQLINNQINNFMNHYDFHQYARTIYTFFWDQFCSIYLEKSKNDESIESYNVLCNTFIKILIMFHPIMPFITEKIYQNMKPIAVKYDFKQSIMIDRFYID